MPVKAPEIVGSRLPDAESLAAPHPDGQIQIPTSQDAVSPDIAIAVSQNQMSVVISEENHRQGSDVAGQGNLQGSAVEESAVAQPEIKVSAFSLKSIRAKRELEQASKANAKEEVHLPTEAFNETDLLLQWTKYAQRLSDKGHKIMESLMLINHPKLQGTTVVHELPNESAKIDFESGKHELVGYLRGKLHNHDIEIRVNVNESIDTRKAFTPQDRYNRLNEINPSLELLRKTFDLEL